MATTAPPPAEQRAPSAASPRLRWAYPVAVGLPLIVLNAGWIAYSEMRTAVTEITIQTLFMGVAFILFVVTLLNLAVRRLFGARAAMSQPELMALYGMLSLATSVAGIGNLGFFLPFLGAPFFRASDGNGWKNWWPLLPPWMGPRDPAVLKGFAEGHDTFFRAEVVRAWLPPLAAWSAFFLVLLWTLLCLAALLRRRWNDEEHLAFPVVALPLEMTREGAPLYRDRLLWVGFAVPLLLHSLNSLHSLYPTLPSFPINTSKQLLDGVPYPLNGLGSVLFLLHPSGVGFGFLVNTDVLFSLWFFYWLKKLLNLFGTVMNWRDPGPNEYGDGSAQFPFTGYQAWGAWLAVAATVLWTGWPYFRAYLDRAFAGDPSDRKAGEAMSARQAVLGFTLGFAILCGFAIVGGASPWVPVAFIGVYVLIMVALSRLEAETAVLSPLLAWVAPQDMLPAVLGTGNIAKPDLAHMATLSWFNLDYRAAPMPQQLQAIVGLKRAGAPRLAPFVGLLMLAAAVGILSSLLWGLNLYYTQGAMTANVNGYRTTMGTVPWWKLEGWLKNPRPPEPGALLGMGVGGGVTLLLTVLRSRFMGFPLAPAAYVLNVTWANELFWFDLFVAWALKSALLRYGGIKLYRAALPFFLGLILGDFVTGAAWSIVAALLGVQVFRTFPN